MIYKQQHEDVTEPLFAESDAGGLLGAPPGTIEPATLPPCEACRGTGIDRAALAAWNAGNNRSAAVGRRELLEVFVPGAPKPAGNLKAFVNPKTGRAIVAKSGGQTQSAWRADVQAAVLRAAGEIGAVSSPCSIHLDFVLPRPVSLPKSRTPRHTKRPDADKLIRAIKDALTGLVWADDAQADRGSWNKRYAEFGEVPGCHIRVLAEES